MSILRGPVLLMVLVGFLTFGMYSAASDAEKGIAAPEFRCRRSGMKTLVTSIGRSAGTTGVLALGGALELGIAVWLVMMIKNGDTSGE